MVTAVFQLLEILLRLFTWAVFLAVLFNLLSAFGVLDTRNRVVWMIGDFLYRVTEPALRPIRNIMPNFGAVDISPMILLIILYIVQSTILPRLEVAILGGQWQSFLL